MPDIPTRPGHLAGSFVLPEFGPGKQRKAQAIQYDVLGERVTEMFHNVPGCGKLMSRCQKRVKCPIDRPFKRCWKLEQSWNGDVAAKAL